MNVAQLREALKSFKMTDVDFKGYAELYNKLHSEREIIGRWKFLRNPDEGGIMQYSSLPVPDKESLKACLARLAVCKLNGGLGTSMNCQGPKSAIIVRGKKTFLDLIIEQMIELNNKFQSDVPLMLMNSFRTHSITERTIGLSLGATKIISFCQNWYPRLLDDDSGFLDPLKFNLDAWYPPGHGDLYSCLLDKGYIDDLLKEGREYLFISNSDNLGATVDLKILNFIINNEIPFLMEVTSKTEVDAKGGALYQGKSQIKLLEIADVPPEYISEFCGTDKFNFFNTNNIWVNLVQIKKLLEEGTLNLDLIVNRKKIKNLKILQLETAVGSAFNSIPGAVGMNVPRSRFLPVKKTSDLLLVQSGLYKLERGTLKRDLDVKVTSLPKIHLTSPFDDLKEYQKRIPVAPDISSLDALELEGQVFFKGEVTLKGNVRLISKKKSIKVPKGAVLENKEVES
jgi:UTP--glucose-1-phosphate uridylyltransferase